MAELDLSIDDLRTDFKKPSDEIEPGTKGLPKIEEAPESKLDIKLPTKFKDARDGELGFLPRQDGSKGVSTEMSITVTDPRLNGGKPTNIPLLVKGQIDTEALISTPMDQLQHSEQQQEIAILRAAQRIAEGGYLPEYDTIDEAVAAAQRRSKQKETHPENPLKSAFNLLKSVPEGTATVGRSIVRGSSNAVLETGDFIASLFQDAVKPQFDETGRPVTDENGEPVLVPDDSVMRMSLATRKEIEKVQNQLTQVWGKADSQAESLVEGVAQFFTAAGPAAKAGKLIPGLTSDFLRWMAAGGVADLTAFDPFAPNVSSILTTYNNPIANNTFTQWLATDTEDQDAEFENRMRRALEGGVLGIASNAIIKTASVSVSQARALRARNKTLKANNTQRRVAGLEDVISSPDTVVTKTPKGAINAREQLFEFDEIDKLRQATGKPETQLADIAAITKDQLEGRDVMNVTVTAKNGVPMKVISGEDVIDTVKTTGSPRIKVRVIDEVDQAKIEADAGTVKGLHNSARDKMRQAEDSIGKNIIKELSAKNFTDFSAGVKSALVKKAGPFGQFAVDKLEIVAGSHSRAIQRYNDAYRDIWAGLSPHDTNILDDMIDSYRSAQIDFNNVGKRKQKLAGGVSGKQHANAILDLQQKNPKLYADLRNRANNYFNFMRSELKDMLDNGLITKQQHDRLKRFDFTPREYLAEIDPINDVASKAASKAQGKPISVGDSGIQTLRGGSEEFNNLNQRELLQQIAARTDARIARNTANQQLFRIADKKLAPDLVSMKPFRGSDKVQVLVKGQRKTMYMPKEMAEQWTGSVPLIWGEMENFMRIASGSTILRPLTTGINPEFVITDFPRAIAHTYMAAPKQVGFSANPVAFFAQMGSDLVETAQDAWFRQGAWKDFIAEGGGMDFLTDQGVKVLKQPNNGMFNTQAAKHKVVEAMSYLNKTAEIWPRLALRNRALKSGMFSQDATIQARRILDYSQGGVVIKNLDAISPYINASVQAIRTTVKEARRDPGRFAQKVMWNSTISAGFITANAMQYPELFDELPDEMHSRYYILGLPWKITDVNGETRRAYIPIKKDETVSLLNSIMDMSIIQYVAKRPIDKEFHSQVVANLPTITENFIPTVDALSTYISNYDRFTNRNVWQETPIGTIDPSQEFKRDFRSDGRIQAPTSPIAKDAAALLSPITSSIIPGSKNLSPARLEAAYGKIVPGNMYTDLMGRQYAIMANQVPEEIQRQSIDEAILRTPVLRKVIRTTSPHATQIRRSKQTAIDSASSDFDQVKDLEQKLGKMRRGELSQESILNWISQRDPVIADSMREKFKNMIKIDAKRSQVNFDLPYMPQIGWWSWATGLAPKQRADVFYEEYSRQDLNVQRAMDNAANVLPQFGSTKFRQRLQHLKDNLGHHEDSK